MHKCSRCQSVRVASITAKCSDCCNIHFMKVDNDGYVPGDMGIGGGDYVEFSWCLDCGQIQGKFPMRNTDFEEAISDDDVKNFFNEHFTTGKFVNALGISDQMDAVHYAKNLHVSFGKFVKGFLNRNNHITSSAKFPTSELFLKMFIANDTDCSED